jgi:hypothetical protein
MTDRQSPTARLHELVLGARRPEALLLDEGHLPDGWADEYLINLAEAQAQNATSSFWPRPLFQAVHFVSCHLSLRYGVWQQSTGRTNPETEGLLGRIQMESELFFWNSVTFIPSFSEIVVQPMGDGIDERDVGLVTRCFKKNAVIDAGQDADEATIREWREQYRAAVLAIGPRWRSRSEVWKWIVLAIRFASFYLDLSLIFQEVERQYGTRPGLDPGRIRSTVDGLRSEFDNENTVAIIDLWLRISDLQRDSSGFPCVGEIRDPRNCPTVGVRTVSELFLQTTGP